MSEYKYAVAVNDLNEFEPEIRETLSLSPEFMDKFSSTKPTIEHDIRKWTNLTIPNDRTGDCYGGFMTIMAELKQWHDESAFGVIHVLRVTAGEYSFSQRLTPPPGGFFGIKGDGMDNTIFYTSASNSWMGINQFKPGDPDYYGEHMYFSDFAIDGSNQPIGSSYVSGLKGFIMHNVRDTYLERVKVKNTHATGFGFDYCSNLRFKSCIADNAGRGRKVHDPDPSTRFGSGSGFGIGYGQKRDESVYLDDCEARNCGASGFFAEQLGQPEAIFKATGMFITGGLSEYNAIGFNDTGTCSSSVNGLTTRYNSYAGVRIGISNASEQGGINGQINGLVSYKNRFGVVLEGSAEGSYTLNAPEVYENTEDGFVWRNTVNAWPAPYLRILNPHVHHNGGKGFNFATLAPIVGLEITGMLCHDNVGDGIGGVSPLGNPKFTGRVFGNGGWACRLVGKGALEYPEIKLNVRGSRNGGLYSTRPVDDSSRVEIYGNPATVGQFVQQPRPSQSTVLGTDWIGQSATIAYASNGVDDVNSEVGPHILATSTGSSPRIIGTPCPVTPAQIITVSIQVVAPWGKSIAPTVRYGSGSTATWVAGPLQRATGVKQTLHFTTVVPAGENQVRVGAIGMAGTDAWASGNVMRVTRSNLVYGSQYWGYIDGYESNAAWTGTPGNSTSVLTIPVQTAPAPGFIDDFNRADGPVGTTADGKEWVTQVSSGSIPALVIVNNAAKVVSSGGTAPRAIYTLEGDKADGQLRAVIRSLGEGRMGLLVRGADPNNFIALYWNRSSTVKTYALQKRVNGQVTELAYANSVEAKSGDDISIFLNGTSIEVWVNGSMIFGGPITVTDFATVTKHGLAYSNASTLREESVDSIQFTAKTT